MESLPSWWAEGFLCENCNCTSVCPGHISFHQRCTHDRCLGYWAIRIDQGWWGDVELAGCHAFIMNDGPQIMIEGGWRQEIYLDEDTSAAQREALEAIFTGRAGSGWAVLATMIAERWGPYVVPIRIEERSKGFAVSAGSVAQSSAEWIKGVDRSRPVMLQNIFNQIHGTEHGLALGATVHGGERIQACFEGTHAIWSRFSWRGP